MSTVACGAALLLVALAAIVTGADRGSAGPAFANAATQEFTAVADSYVRSDRTTTKYGTLAELWADNSPVTRSYLRFQVAGVSGTINRTLLRVRVTANHTTGFQVRGVSNTTWGESTITWSNAPAVSSTVTGTSGRLTAGTWVNVDVTALIRTAGTYSLALTTTSSSNAVLASRETGANAPRLVVESTPADTTAPNTTISAGPTGTVTSGAASLSFSSSETGSTFQCALDSGAYATCTSPKSYSGLADGVHTFSVRATDAAGNTDATPATRTWTVQTPDTTAPDTAITAGPSGTVASGQAGLSFTSEPGATFQCSLDAGGYAPCTSPKDYTGLADGEHTFRVSATDAAGNTDPTPATRTWTVQTADTTAPDTAIERAPTDTYRSGAADFTFASEPGARFECRIDGGAFADCAASPTFHVANGRHELEARAVDSAGNADPTPATKTWWADALMQNGNFETPITGWTTQNGGYAVAAWRTGIGTLSTVGGGMAGPQAGRVVAATTGSLEMHGSPRPINSAALGATYAARGSVRSETPGKTVCLRLREWNNDAIVGSAQRCVTTTGSWTSFGALDYTTLQNGSELDLLAYQTATTAVGDSFDLDGVSISNGSPEVAPTPEPSGDPVLLAAGDVASCWSSGDESVSQLLDSLPGTIAIVGDTEQNHGYTDEFSGCFDPSWGRHRARTKPAVGDHEYSTPGAPGYFDYFGAAAGERGKGWYSYDLGSWHIVVLNSNCDELGGCGPGTEQYEWLKQDLEANAGSCIGSYVHHPRFSGGGVHGSQTRVQPFWELLYQHRAEWVLGGNDHNYQRFAPQTPTGELDANGIRQFVVGTGGTMHYALGAPLPGTEVQNSGAFGVLKLTLHDGSYDWRFIAQDGKSFTDSGSKDCSPLPGPAEPPDTTIDSGPSGTTQSTAASFGFSGSGGAASFECSLDTGTFAACTSPKAYSGLAAGEHTFRVRALSAGGAPDATPASRTWTVAAPAPNLIVNGDFEASVSGWYGYKAGVSSVTGGAEGAKAARIALNASATSFSVATSPYPVTSTVAGTRYEAGAFIRSNVPGRTACLRIREWQNGAQIGSAQSCRAAPSAWDRFTSVPYTALGGGSIEVYAYQLNAVTGDSFDLDGVTLRVVP